ncbi:unnamed protein product [Symbiodinium necroappetens]|uniref:Uncharacterized protein n=1 Tax=Symbiodinium necroappetens TaxID=1628268 RepID=A0A812Y941_9DINO|nr:unnamed protein product [Symbiodinium necroappetens]
MFVRNKATLGSTIAAQACFINGFKKDSCEHVDDGLVESVPFHLLSFFRTAASTQVGESFQLSRESLLPASASKSFHPELLSTLRILERETSSDGPSSEEREARAEQKGGKGPKLAACGCTAGLWRYIAEQLNLSRCCNLRSLLGYSAQGEAAPTRTDAGCGRSAHSCLESALVPARCPWHLHYPQHESDQSMSAVRSLHSAES